MKVMHVISGGETGGSKNHIISLLKTFPTAEILLVVMQEGMLRQEAEKEGIRTINLNQKNRYDLKARKKLIDIAKQDNVNLIHTHGARANFFIATLISKLNITWVTTVHSDPSLDFMKTGLKGKLFTKLNLWAYSKIDYFFAVSEPFKQNLISIGIEENKISTILNGIDFDTKEETNLTREDLQIAEDDFVITIVARLHPIKGHRELLRATSQVIEQHEDLNIKLFLVGDGKEKQTLEELTDVLKMNQNVKFLGYRDDVPAIYRLSNVAILTSYSESFPLALLEAAKEKLPLIATDVGGIANLVQKHGWLIQPKSVEEIEKALHDVITEHKKGTLKDIGTKQYEYAKENFSVNKLAENMKKSYLQLVKNTHLKEYR
ncbi:glycosyltransferase [Bacillaceae bacterium W0354]